MSHTPIQQVSRSSYISNRIWYKKRVKLERNLIQSLKSRREYFPSFNINNMERKKTRISTRIKTFFFFLHLGQNMERKKTMISTLWRKLYGGKPPSLQSPTISATISYNNPPPSLSSSSSSSSHSNNNLQRNRSTLSRFFLLPLGSSYRSVKQGGKGKKMEQFRSKDT